MSPGGRLSTIRQFAPMETIVKEHEHGETAFVIEKGKVEVTRIRDGVIVHIAFLEAGATFGEMGVVDGAPRSATVTAVEETLVREIHRNDIHGAMRESPDAVIKVLKNIFDRLREANMRIAQLESGAKAAVYSIEGLTPQAKEAIPDNPFTFTSFPFKIGRKTNDALVNNHLEIQDQDPLQISRHHVSIVREDGKLGVIDRGSKLGAVVDDVHIGGKKHPPGPAFFKGEEGILILGTAASPYRFRIRRCAD
jgi:CRP-like cAMP-binding protein